MNGRRYYRKCVGYAVIFVAAGLAIGFYVRSTGKHPPSSSQSSEAPALHHRGQTEAVTSASVASLAPSTKSKRNQDVIGPALRLHSPTTEVRRRNRDAALDPRSDGWKTEDVAARAELLLKQLVGQRLSGPVGDDTVADAGLTDGFACAHLRPDQLTETYRDDTIVVRRGDSASLLQARPAHRGDAGLTHAVTKLREGVASETDSNVISCTAKVRDVSLRGALVASLVDVQLRSEGDSQVAQVNALWDCLWEYNEEQENPLKLSAVRVRNYEEVHTLKDSGAWFRDCTRSVLNDNPSFREQLVFGLDHWLKRIERTHRIHVFAATGLAVGDADGDGLDDLYVCQPGGLPNRLFLQDVDGTARDYSVTAGVDWLDASSSALFLDLDNDADQDLVVATLSGLLVLENDSTGRFALRGILPMDGADMQSMSAADYDQDGDLDLYVCLNFPRATPANVQAETFVYHDANDGARNRLYRNEIETGKRWAFVDATASSGLDQDNRRHSLAAAWEDYDNDGDQDLYVANDYGRNCLYVNQGGKFINKAGEAGVVDFGSGMSVSWADYNHDGWIDLYVGNMFSTAGSRVTRQEQFRPEASARTRGILRRFAKGNTLFESLGNGGFREDVRQPAIQLGRWAWSSIFVDVDNNGWEDLFVANGYITANDTLDL